MISEHLVASEKHSTNKLIDVDYSYIRSVLAGPWADGVCRPPFTPAAKKVKKKKKPKNHCLSFVPIVFTQTRSSETVNTGCNNSLHWEKDGENLDKMLRTN